MKRLKIVLLSALLTVTVGAFAGWSGSGSFTRTHDWTDDAAAGIPITASRMDAEDDNFATGINACLAKNGENAATGNLNIGGYRLTAVGAGSAATDACTIGGSETLTNKTLTSPTLSGTPVIDLSGITSAGDLPITQGGTGASTAADARTNLGLTIGTSGATVPLLNGNNTHSGNNTFSGTNTYTGVVNFTAAPTFTDPATTRNNLRTRSSVAVNGLVEGLFTGVPANCKRIVMSLVGISTDGTNDLIVQLGSGGAIEDTGYVGAVSRMATTAVETNASSSAGATVANDIAASDSVHGQIVLDLVSSNTWTVTAMLFKGSKTFIASGYKATSGTLDQVRIHTGNTFDAGTVTAEFQ